MAKEVKEANPGLVGGLFAAMIDRHGQVDIRLQKVNVSVPGSALGLELNGTVTVTVHLRDLTPVEKQAHVESNVAAIRH
jgi:hypothetical protein